MVPRGGWMPWAVSVTRACSRASLVSRARVCSRGCVRPVRSFLTARSLMPAAESHLTLDQRTGAPAPPPIQEADDSTLVEVLVGVMDVHDVHALETEPLETLIKRPQGPVVAEVEDWIESRDAGPGRLPIRTDLITTSVSGPTAISRSARFGTRRRSWMRSGSG